MTEFRKLQKVGNSYYVILPRDFVQALGLARKDVICLRLYRRHVTIAPVAKSILKFFTKKGKEK